MPRKRQAECPQCHGENPRCKYLTGGRICEYGKAKGKAKGKAIGKAISKETKAQFWEYDSLIGNLHTDYLNYMEDRYYKLLPSYSFERYLTLNDNRKLASWLRRRYKENMKQFNVQNKKMTADEFEKLMYNRQFGKRDDAIRFNLDKEQPKTDEELERLRIKQEAKTNDVIHAQTLEQAQEIAKDIESTIKYQENKGLSDMEVLQSIAEMANEIDLTHFPKMK